MFSDGEGVVFNVERMDPVGDPNSSTSHAAGDLLIPFTVSLLQFWAWLFKTNDVVSLRFVKISNINISNIPIFFVEKM